MRIKYPTANSPQKGANVAVALFSSVRGKVSPLLRVSWAKLQRMRLFRCARIMSSFHMSQLPVRFNTDLHSIVCMYVVGSITNQSSTTVQPFYGGGGSFAVLGVNH